MVDLDPKAIAKQIMLEVQCNDFGTRLENGDFRCSNSQIDLLEKVCMKAAERVIRHLSATVPAGDGELVERLTAEADYLDANLKTFTGPLSTITALRDAASRLSQGTGVTVPNEKWSDREPLYEAAIAAYEANTPKDYRYSALAMVKAVDAVLAALSGDTL